MHATLFAFTVHTPIRSVKIQAKDESQAKGRAANELRRCDGAKLTREDIDGFTVTRGWYFNN